MAGKDNLVPLTTEKAREIGKIGAQKSIESRRKKKEKKDLIRALFESKPPKELVQRLKKFYPSLDFKDIEETLDFAMVHHTINKGNVQAYNALNDRAYGKPPQKIEQETTSINLNKEASEKEHEEIKQAIIKSFQNKRS